MAELECRACLGPMPPADGQGRPRTWCSDRCRRDVSKWRRQEGMKRDELTLMRAIEELNGPTTHTADLIAELVHELEVVEWTRSQEREAGQVE